MLCILIQKIYDLRVQLIHISDFENNPIIQVKFDYLKVLVIFKLFLLPNTLLFSLPE